MKKYRYPFAVAIINWVFIFQFNTITAFEHDVGLHYFYLARALLLNPAPPSDIIDIEIDQSTFLETPAIRDCLQKYRGTIDSRCFSRRLHADLIRTLNRHGVKLIVFNLLFRERRDGEDIEFAKAIQQAGNVLLQDYQEKRFLGADIEFVDVAPPVEPLGQSALSAPLAIPDNYAAGTPLWLFLNLIHADQDRAQDVDQAILPVAAFNMLILTEYQHVLVNALRPLRPDLSSAIASFAMHTHDRAAFNMLIERLLTTFGDDSELQSQLNAELEQNHDVDAHGKQLLKRFFALYQPGNDTFLNAYGPYKTIATIGYHQVAALLLKDPQLFRDKVVFIGPSLEWGRSSKGGTINTAYGQISSTELSATLFANLRDNETLRAIDDHIALGIAVFWSLGVLVTQMRFRAKMAFNVLMLASGSYLIASLILFCAENRLLPWLCVLLQASLAMLVSALEHYLSQRRQLNDMLDANVPSELLDVLDQRDFVAMHQGAHFVGVCLAADGEGYTKLGASHGYHWLAEFMLAYQPMVEQCIHQHHGAIKDWAGDGVVALWIEPRKTRQAGILDRWFKGASVENRHDIHAQALHAALKMIKEVETFNQRQGVSFPVRIGLSYGPLWLSFVDELKAFGDTLNVASRIEGLNKITRTRILMTQDFAQDSSEFLIRRLGKFLLRGHQRALDIFELMGYKADAGHEMLVLVRRFSTALQYFENDDKHQALKLFHGILQDHPDDGPSRYFYQRCMEDENASSLAVSGEDE